MKSLIIALLFLIFLYEAHSEVLMNACFTVEQKQGGPIISKENQENGISGDTSSELQYLGIVQRSKKQLEFSFDLTQYNRHFCGGNGSAKLDEHTQKYVFTKNGCHIEFILRKDSVTMSEIDPDLKHDCEELFTCGQNVYLDKVDEFKVNKDLNFESCFDKNHG